MPLLGLWNALHCFPDKELRLGEWLLEYCAVGCLERQFLLNNFAFNFNFPPLMFRLVQLLSYRGHLHHDCVYVQKCDREHVFLACHAPPPLTTWLCNYRTLTRAHCKYPHHASAFLPNLPRRWRETKFWDIFRQKDFSNGNWSTSVWESNLWERTAVAVMNLLSTTVPVWRWVDNWSELALEWLLIWLWLKNWKALLVW